MDLLGEVDYCTVNTVCWSRGGPNGDGDHSLCLEHGLTYILSSLSRLLTVNPVCCLRERLLGLACTHVECAGFRTTQHFFRETLCLTNYRFWETTSVMTHVSFRRNWLSITIVAKVIFTIFDKARLVSLVTPYVLRYIEYSMCFNNHCNECLKVPMGYINHFC